MRNERGEEECQRGMAQHAGELVDPVLDVPPRMVAGEADGDVEFLGQHEDVDKVEDVGRRDEVGREEIEAVREEGAQPVELSGRAKDAADEQKNNR